jgi:hypothetical protein
MALSTSNTVLVYVVVPAALFAVIAGLAMIGGGRRGGRRYRPGRPYEFTPVWFLSAPGDLVDAGSGRELTAGTNRPMLAGAPAEEAPERPAVPRGTGGASDRW